jgi:hypothetical protein
MFENDLEVEIEFQRMAPCFRTSVEILMSLQVFEQYGDILPIVSYSAMCSKSYLLLVYLVLLKLIDFISKTLKLPERTRVQSKGAGYENLIPILPRTFAILRRRYTPLRMLIEISLVSSLRGTESSRRELDMRISFQFFPGPSLSFDDVTLRSGCLLRLAW